MRPSRQLDAVFPLLCRRLTEQTRAAKAAAGHGYRGGHRLSIRRQSSRSRGQLPAQAAAYLIVRLTDTSCFRPIISGRIGSCL